MLPTNDYTPGHASRHKVSLRDPRVIAARNSPTRLYVGTNSGGNQVAGFWRDGFVVFTDLADTTSVNTTYETELTNIRDVRPRNALVSCARSFRSWLGRR